MSNTHLQNINLEKLNESYVILSPSQRITKFYQDFSTKETLVTSSFGTTAVMLLHLISEVNKKQKIYFIDTTFHFEETIAYKENLTNSFNLEVEDVLPDPTHNKLTRESKSWEKEAGLCCMVNKVITLDAVKVNYKYWISGRMAYQNHFRTKLNVFEISGNHLKFNPLIDVSSADWNKYIEKFRLPKHPLLPKGYGSVSCTHCTVKGEGRSGRWKGKVKTECGLHS